MKLFNKKEEKEKKISSQSEPAVVRASANASIQSAWITEKAGDLGKLRQYVFLAALRATKPEIKSAVEEKYKVKVTAVRMNRMPGKAKRRGAQMGKAREFKKAIVTVK